MGASWDQTVSDGEAVALFRSELREVAPGALLEEPFWDETLRHHAYLFDAWPNEDGRFAVNGIPSSAVAGLSIVWIPVEGSCAPWGP